MNAHPFLADDLVYRSLLAKIAKLESRIKRLEAESPKPFRKAQRAQLDRGQADAEVFAAMAPACQRIADRFGMSLVELRGRNRGQFQTEARRAAMQACLDAGFSTPVIGRFFDGRDHTTVLQIIGRRVR